MNKRLLAIACGLAFAAPSFAVENTAGGSTLLDLDDVLGASIDTVEDAPEFVTPPAGSYVLSISGAKAEKYKTTNRETQQEEEKVRIKIIYSVVETKELSDPEEQPVGKGAMFSEQFMTNPEGLSYFKRQAKNVLGEAVIKGAAIGDILKELENGHTFSADVKIKTSSGKDASGAKKVFTNVQVRIKPSHPAELAAS